MNQQIAIRKDNLQAKQTPRYYAFLERASLKLILQTNVASLRISAIRFAGFV